MEDNYIKILDSFNINDYIETKQIKKELKEADHIEATKIIKKYGIVQPYDYVRACGKTQIGALGVYFGYKSKLAQNDKNKEIYVVWIGDNTGELTVAIEVEFKEDWLDAMVRLISVSLASSYASNVINIIVSEKEEDYISIRNMANMDMISLLPINLKLAHITTQKLIGILSMRDNRVESDLVRKKFFNELRYI